MQPETEPPVLVCRVAWMQFYRGANGDPAKGGGRYVSLHRFGHEALNFHDNGGAFYGFVEPMGRGENLGRFGAPRAESLSGVLVVWVAKHPNDGGQRVVGWYSDATVFAVRQPAAPGQPSLPDGSPPDFIARSATAQANVWYPGPEWAMRLRDYVESHGNVGSQGRREPPTIVSTHAPAHLEDTERRLAVEATGMRTTAEWYEARGFEVDDVSAQRLGWDLVATRGATRLRVEVKATSLPLERARVEVTPNEYANMGAADRATFRLALVVDAEASADVRVFSWSDELDCWAAHDGSTELAIVERVAAKLSAVPLHRGNSEQ